MGLLGKLLKKEEKSKGGCCSFNLEDEIAKVDSKDIKKEKESSCCDFDLDAEINKAKNQKKNSCCG
ncbi:hypothetical protein [Psychrilyobacter atlanticus]|uniref:hypothetical protein n=1 Tax=Psychrilyobacter atlanticus TaxID=271091 RepID=UPI000423303F|nr:hypothetical protein [Psychrilyobacter atlanticus]